MLAQVLIMICTVYCLVTSTQYMLRTNDKKSIYLLNYKCALYIHKIGLDLEYVTRRRRRRRRTTTTTTTTFTLIERDARVEKPTQT